jgi:hypothetical protein
MKIVVFDLDETLGYFTEYGIFWDCLSNYIKLEKNNPLTQNDFNNILNLFPEFLRPNIINILLYLKKKKQSDYCHKMLIYTNNQGPKEWTRHIVSYFESVIGSKLFDQIISAFKVNGKIVEICRTTHNKTHKDLIKCTKIPEDAEICFLDDCFYPEMSTENIFYINVKPYYYDLKFEDMIDRFKNSKYGKAIIDNNTDIFTTFMMNDIKRYQYEIIEKDPKEYDIDKILGKQIILHLKFFFKKTNKNKCMNMKTRKHITYKKNKTQRNK